MSCLRFTIANGIPPDSPTNITKQEYRKAGREQLEVFHKTYSAAPADVLYQEKPFELPLDGDVVVTGRMDQVNRIGDGTIEIVDYKTGKAARREESGRRFAAQCLCAGGARNSRCDSGAPGFSTT